MLRRFYPNWVEKANGQIFQSQESGDGSQKRGLVEGFPLIDGFDQVIHLVGREGAASGPFQLMTAIDEDSGTAPLRIQRRKQGLCTPRGQIQRACK